MMTNMPIADPTAEHTCVFNGTVLSETTREEHTIQESVGGRYRSRQVTCDACNQRAGDVLDPALKAPYVLLLAALGPLLPERAKAGRIPLTTRDGASGPAIDRDGALVLTKPMVTHRDPVAGRPKGGLAPDAPSLEKLMRQAHGEGVRFETQTVPLSILGSTHLSLSGVTPPRHSFRG
jgi:hypothetical protein